ncbi:MAG: hypothetical protein U0236_07745 [Nitrospira sp.]
MSILDHKKLKQVIGVPQSVTILAYLCLGYVSPFQAQPDLETAGWRRRIPVERLIHDERWGNRIYSKGGDGDADHQASIQERRRRKTRLAGGQPVWKDSDASRSLRHD